MRVSRNGSKATEIVAYIYSIVQLIALFVKKGPLSSVEHPRGLSCIKVWLNPIVYCSDIYGGWIPQHGGSSHVPHP
ncbi:hypothetical protein J22TS3_49040 [Paenibacillus sp. J22TS3]|nr:hypothetical protein J22TS3_49040 [Paenibacillus sp. J22TS3]